MRACCLACGASGEGQAVSQAPKPSAPNLLQRPAMDVGTCLGEEHFQRTFEQTFTTVGPYMGPNMFAMSSHSPSSGAAVSSHQNPTHQYPAPQQCQAPSVLEGRYVEDAAAGASVMVRDARVGDGAGMTMQGARALEETGCGGRGSAEGARSARLLKVPLLPDATAAASAASAVSAASAASTASVAPQPPHSKCAQGTHA